MKEAPLQKTQFDPSKYRGSDVKQSEEHSPAYEKAARAFNNIWATGNASAAKDIMVDDVKIVSTLKTLKYVVKSVVKNKWPATAGLDSLIAICLRSPVA